MSQNSMQRAEWEHLDKNLMLDVTYDDVDVIAAYQKKDFWSVRDEVFKDRMDNEKVKKLLDMPDWEFCLVFRDGMGDACAGCIYSGIYFSEWEIAAAYKIKWPESDPLF